MKNIQVFVRVTRKLIITIQVHHLSEVTFNDLTNLGLRIILRW